LFLLLGGLWLLNAAAFHYWAGGGPAVDAADTHIPWGHIFAAVGTASLVAAGLTTYLLRASKSARAS
jgi:hypothetical protein